MKNAVKSVSKAASAPQGSTRMKEGTVCPRPSAPATTMVSSSSLRTFSQTTIPCGKCRQLAQPGCPGGQWRLPQRQNWNWKRILRIVYFSDGQTEASKRHDLSRLACQAGSRARVLPGLQWLLCVSSATSMPTVGFLELCCPLARARPYFPLSRLENGGVPISSS